MPPSKRLFDLLLASVLLVPLLPVMAVIACAIAVVDGAPIFYRSERMRSSQRSFSLLKFRTMQVSENDYGVTGGDKSKRITRLGGVLRQRRLDELPQLFNILAGDMSFVGPRPPLRQYVRRFPDLYADVLKSRPGVTGLASLIYSRHENLLLSRCVSAEATDKTYSSCCIPTKARIDLIYQRERSMCLDIKIIFKTAISVFQQQ